MRIVIRSTPDDKPRLAVLFIVDSHFGGTSKREVIFRVRHA